MPERAHEGGELSMNNNICSLRLKLAIMDPGNNELPGRTFSIEYHNMNNVVVFLVLRLNY